MNTKFKFKLKSFIVEAETYGDGLFKIDMEPDFLVRQKILTLDELKKYFIPADCNALNLVDPDRTERLYSQIKGE